MNDINSKLTNHLNVGTSGLVEKHSLINDDQSFESAIGRYNNPIKSYDDGFGPLWIMIDSTGIVGIVRASTWDNAFNVFLDEIIPPIGKDEIEDAYNENNELNEGYAYQPNAHGSSGIVSLDLNGWFIEQLNQKMVDDLEIKLTILNNE